MIEVGAADFSMVWAGGWSPPSRKVSAILKAPITITTTLKPTRIERTRDGLADVSVASAPAAVTLAVAFAAALRAASVSAVTRLGFSLVAAAAACAARRAAAMKFDWPLPSAGGAASWPSPMSDAAMASARLRAPPGSSGKSGGRFGSIGWRCAICCHSGTGAASSSRNIAAGGAAAVGIRTSLICGCTGFDSSGRIAAAGAYGAGCAIARGSGADCTRRRSPSIIARRSTTWLRVECSASSVSCVRRSVADWLLRTSDSSRLMVSTRPSASASPPLAVAKLVR